MRDDSRASVLVVEDDRVIRTAVSFLLQGAGYAVHEEADGAAALAALAGGLRPLAIVTDLMMPNVTGAGLAAACRDGSPFDAVPIIVFTAIDVDAATIAVLAAMPAVTVLRKPAGVRVLVEELARLIAASKD